MNAPSDRWRLIEALCHAALALPAPEREAFVAASSGADDALREEVDTLLAREPDVEAFLSRPLDVVVQSLLCDSDAVLVAGARVGPFQIVSLIGAGGMGDVYRARDTRLERDVALKVLPASVSADRERLARFEQEARLLASLNHPSICTVYGIETLEHGTDTPVVAIVMELLAGETLASRLSRGSLQVDEALRLASAIAAALEVAHDQGIVHRDLTPSNVSIGPGSTVKVLDFGLAKIASPRGSVPTSSLMTTPGTVLGTPAYMSPEQVQGADVDCRSDVWAFGCLLFEMLTTTSPFRGSTPGDTLAGVLRSDPDWQRLPVTTPEPIRRLLRRALQKDPAHRLRDIHDARLEIDEARNGSPQDRQAPVAHLRTRERWAWVMALGAALLIALVSWRFGTVPAPAGELRLDVTTPPTNDSSMALSPDGSTLVFPARGDGGSQLWLRRLDSTTVRALPGTEEGTEPFWSQDSRSIAFHARGKLRRVDLADGAVRAIADAPTEMGGAWTRDGSILFAPRPGSPLLLLSPGAETGPPVTRFQSPQRSHSSPRLLSDGQHFLYYVSGSAEVRGEYLGRLDGGLNRRLFLSAGPAEYAAGRVFFVRDGTILTQRFDEAQLAVAGDPSAIVEGLAGPVRVSVSPAGPIAYRPSAPDGNLRVLEWVDRSGHELSRVIYSDAASQAPALSPDGQQIAMARFVSGNMDIWRYDTPRRTWNRETFHSRDEIFPLWSPDGHRLLFGSGRDGTMNLYVKTVGGEPDSERMLFSTGQVKFATDWSADGAAVLFDSVDPVRGSDIWTVPADGAGVPVPLVQTDFNESQAQFSPDTRWIAYQSDKTGQLEIYLQQFPGGGHEVRVSTDGGSQARWSSTGRELFYLRPDDRLVSVAIHLDAGGAAVSAPVPLFQTDVGRGAMNRLRQQYVVAPGGQSFILNALPEGVSSPPITVISHWKAPQE